MFSLSDIGDHAKRYGALGWRVVVLHGVADSGCTCPKRLACRSQGKHPRVRNWPAEATDNADRIASLFSRWPESNVGVCLGPSSDLVDIEFDDSEGQMTAERLLGDCCTPTFRSSRSVHRLFRFPTTFAPSKATEAIEGLELRFGTEAKGAQSVLPPSLHCSGAKYEWCPERSPFECPPLPFPDVIAEMLSKASSHGTTEFVMAEDVGDLATHPGAPKGQRHRTFCRLIGRQLRIRGADADLVPLALDWCDRCTPPWPHDEALANLRGLVQQDIATRPSNGTSKGSAHTSSASAGMAMSSRGS